MKRKYNVISHKGVDVSLIDADLVATTAKENIPDRQVGIYSALKRSKRVTTFLLTDDEAKNLRLDNRVLDVELDISEREDVSVQYGQISTHDFDRNANHNSTNLGNWGLKRHTQENLDNYNTNGSLQSGHETLEFELSGDGVDIIIWDTGLDAEHPDFNDANGRSRVQKINWGDIYLKANSGVLDSQYDPVTFNLAHQPDVYYRDFGGHGTSCASIAAGFRFGMAKKAHIYLARQNEFGLFWQTQLDWLDTIIYWHERKDNNRPTIINNSWGFVTRGANYSEITSGRFRLNAGDDYTVWNNNNFTDEFISNYAQIRLNALNLDTSISNPSNGQTAGEKNLAFDTLLQEAIDAGIHVFNAAGNFSDRIVKPDHHEYDNFVTVVQGEVGTTIEREIYYNRGGSPYSEDAFHIGAIEETIDNSTGTKKDNIAYFSSRGQAVDMYCATNCASAASSWRSSYDESFTYPDDSNYLGRYFGGTSCATPNAVGVAACYLSANPNLTPTQLKTKMLDDSKSDILFERSGSWNSTNPFLDSNNTIMYNRYNQNVGLTTTNLNIQNVVFGNPKYSSTIKGTRDNSLNYIGYNVLAEYQPVHSSTYLGFADDNASSIYENGKLLSLYAVYNGNNIYTYTLKFDGNAYNGGWNWIQITKDNFTDYNLSSLKLYRKNATWDHVKKEFSWTVGKIDERKANLFGTFKLVIN
jgi:subtilisin family serine protease